MPSKSHKKKSTPAVKILSSETSANDDVDKIRDIIFGQQMRVYSERFDRLESRLSEEAQRISQQSEQRFNELQTELTARLDGIAKSLNEESDRRESEGEELRQSLQKTRNEMTDSFGDAGDTLAAELSKISTLVDNTEQGLKSAQDEFSAYIKSQLAALRSEKTESAELSSLFGELASRLSGKEKS